MDSKGRSRKAQYGLIETAVGLIPGWGGTQRLPRLAKQVDEAARMIVDAKRVDADQAKAIGFIDEVVENQEALARRLDALTFDKFQRLKVTRRSETEYLELLPRALKAPHLSDVFDGKIPPASTARLDSSAPEVIDQ